MTSATIAEALGAYYNSEAVRLSFDMYHPTAIDREPELDWTSMENYQRSRARRAEFHLARYEYEYGSTI